MYKKYSYKDISDWFLAKESMTHKKLQKLTYYAEAWSWALLKHGILNDTAFQAWIHGPVSPELWEVYKNYGWNDIPKKDLRNDYLFDEKTLDVLDAVWTTYGQKSGYELECLSHSEDPWKKARNGLLEFQPSNNVINSEDMKIYYTSIYNGD
ncbi:Panacea domain-containing protein [Mycoplasma mycoides]|uniref:Antitoxin SocA-like Panacea domain-containing protein n=1 Tax=Mycoplasma mycoides subsp. capri TaxID=40477 RepID=A0AB38GDU9_MYCMC|nr:type II toxin-antitoxin system antitoxin SocA domain-containing protein [Mycoplasma mycoides]ADH21543.1 cdse [synthetic Mycoplasma mycoides JCVI-syn1.0]AMW76957.1 PF13274 family protein [synthetic bacterium JCVI-Syn2.0]ACU78624.1 CdsE [Mycoplasma mycoides subsp. capri str. GM12]ACU79455.1 CdsE [Mycoplasma mycoides subsp. capri str. GM12]EXU60471.1 hypothetical protein MMC_3650 [Mycoplasma mycoides subsp. capri PG3]